MGIKKNWFINGLEQVAEASSVALFNISWACYDTSWNNLLLKKKRKKQHSSPLSVFSPQNVTVNITLMYVIASVLSLGRKASNPSISQLLLLSRNNKNRLQMHYSNVCNINIKEVWMQLQIPLFLKCLWKTTYLFCLEDICSLCRGSSLAPGSLRVSELQQVARGRTWRAHRRIDLN